MTNLERVLRDLGVKDIKELNPYKPELDRFFIIRTSHSDSGGWLQPVKYTCANCGKYEFHKVCESGPRNTAIYFIQCVGCMMLFTLEQAYWKLVEVPNNTEQA